MKVSVASFARPPLLSARSSKGDVESTAGKLHAVARIIRGKEPAASVDVVTHRLDHTANIDLALQPPRRFSGGRLFRSTAQ